MRVSSEGGSPSFFAVSQEHPRELACRLGRCSFWYFLFQLNYILGLIFFLLATLQADLFFLAWLLEFVKASAYLLTVAMLKAIATERKEPLLAG